MVMLIEEETQIFIKLLYALIYMKKIKGKKMANVI